MLDPDRRQNAARLARLDSRIGLAPSRVLALSYQEVLIESHEWLGLGQRSTLRFMEPPVQLQAFVVRCRLVRVDPTNGRPVYEAGLRFDESPAVRQQLTPLVAGLAGEPEETPLAAAL